VFISFGFSIFGELVMLTKMQHKSSGQSKAKASDKWAQSPHCHSRQSIPPPPIVMLRRSRENLCFFALPCVIVSLQALSKAKE
jgi:hypothetical protein